MEDVAARGEDGLSFDTSRISYDTGGRIFKTSAPVRFVDGRLAVEGVGMELNTATQKAHIQKQVVATISPGKNDK
jgi:lipopolysaccharide export system protein LptC